VTYRSLKYLTNLTAMSLCNNEIEDYELATFSKLKSLKLYDGVFVTGESIRFLTGLESLSLYSQYYVTNRDILGLKNLKELYINDCNQI
jgi:Leucine-rich repeat (LRR) protein